MPRYYFHLAGDDDDGTELPNDAVARSEAKQTFGEMIRDGAVPDVARMDVMDEKGHRVLLLRFSAEP